MRTRIFLIVVALALVALALAGWAVQGAKATARHLSGSRPKEAT